MGEEKTQDIMELSWESVELIYEAITIRRRESPAG